MNDPKLTTPILAGLAAAFNVRGKAIRYHGTLSISEEFEDDIERLNVDYRGLGGLRLRLSVWSTGDLWFLACRPGPRRGGGWLLKHELRGKLSEPSPEKIVKMFEESQLVGYQSPNEQLGWLQKLWKISQLVTKD